LGAVALRLKNGWKRYGSGQREPIFQGIDVELPEGELLVLLGPSGCGKSTLLRCLAGLESLSAGELTVEASGAAGEERPTVGVVFQDPRLMPWLTVRENIALGLRYRRNRTVAARAAATGAVDRLMDELGLGDLADARPDRLSGGQAQRVSLARAVIVRPRVLLLDEPFAALDPRTRAALQDWLLALRSAHGLSAILVTHDVDEALRIGDRVALLSARPGTITRRWIVSDHAGAAEPLRTEILRCYDHDLSRTSQPPPMEAQASAAHDRVPAFSAAPEPPRRPA